MSPSPASPTTCPPPPRCDPRDSAGPDQAGPPKDPAPPAIPVVPADAPAEASVRAALDAAAVAAVRAGDTARFEELVNRHSPRLFGLARKYTRREADVADLVQDVFLRAYRRLDSWRGDAPWEHWLTRLTLNCCYDYLRSQRRRSEDSLADLTDDEGAWLERHGSSTEAESNHAAAARTLVEKVLQQLSPASRMVIELLELEDRSVKEVSALTGWSGPLVKVRAFRARAELRRLIGQLDTRRFL